MRTTAIKEIDARYAQLEKLAIKLWEHPETYGNEFFACDTLCKILTEEGFRVQKGIAGLPTAFRAEWGQGKPVLGFLGEYDALPQMSQKTCAYKEPVTPGGNGHGCGHNLISVGHLGAVLGLKRAMEEHHLLGTLVFYGCPAEEQYLGKVFMARAGCFKELDMAFSFHSGRFNGAFMRSMAALNSVHFVFHGKSAHACISPDLGKSALDAVELMNTGVHFLREHVSQDCRFPYVIPNGGANPVVVPDFASVWYAIVAPTREQVDALHQKICEIAQSAANMTGTRLEIYLESACYPTLYNETISQKLQQTLAEIPQPEWTQEELQFAHALNATLPDEWAQACKNYRCPPETDLYTGIFPYEKGGFWGSTDIGDVSYITPTALLYTTCVNVGAPIHSWQATACFGTSIGVKGAVYGAKVMAAAGLDMLCDPMLLKAAKQEFLQGTGGKPYVCAVNDSIPPYQVRDLF